MAQFEERVVAAESIIYGRQRFLGKAKAQSHSSSQHLLYESDVTQEGLSSSSPSDQSPRSRNADGSGDNEVAQLTTRLEAALRVAQKSLQIQQACISREKALQKQLKEERDRVQVLTAERDLLLAQRIEMLESARSLEAHVRRWSAKEKEYQAKIAEGEKFINTLKEAQHQMLVQIDELTEEVQLLRQKQALPLGYKGFTLNNYAT